MKKLTGFILLVFMMQFAHAQTRHRAAPKKVTHKKKTPEKHVVASLKTTTIIFFHTLTDSVSKGLAIAVDSFAADHSAFQIVRINIDKQPDSLSKDESLKRFANDFTNDLFADAGNRHKVPLSNNIIVAGENEAAVVAFYCAAANPRRIRSTGMFINKYEPFTTLKNAVDSMQLAAAGKLFIYNRKEDVEDIAADNFCDVIAMDEDLLVFKAEAGEGKMPVNLFTEFVNWVTAEGSNYVVKIE